MRVYERVESVSFAERKQRDRRRRLSGLPWLLATGFGCYFYECHFSQPERRRWHSKKATASQKCYV